MVQILCTHLLQIPIYARLRHIDPDHRVAGDRDRAERGGGLHGSTSGITQAPRWKYVFPFIRLLAPLKIYLFIWRCINSFYTRIHEVAGDRALLPVEEHVGADAAVAGIWQTVVSQRLSIDVQLVAELGGHGQVLGIYQPRSLPPLRRRPWSGDIGMVVGLNA